MTVSRGRIAALSAALLMTVYAQGNSAGRPDKAPPVAPSSPIPPISVPWPAERTGSTTGTTSQLTGLSQLFKAPVDMKLLILSADGTEPGFAALQFFLDYLGLPYDAVILKNSPLPALNDSTRGFYQGIVLATGSLGYNNNGVWTSALDAAGWTKIDDYMRSHGVRVVSYYTWPEARYGLAPVSSLSTSASSPASIVFPAASSTIFPYLVRTNPLKVTDTYLYLAAAAPASGETTVPILTINSRVAGAIHTKADGREFMAFTFDNNPYLQHSLALNYGIFNWVTKGIFLGERRIYLTAQNDDYFLANDLFALSPAACRPVDFVVDPTYDPAAECPTDRMDGGDVKALEDWQKSWQSKAQTKNIRVTHAFNAYGTTPEGGAEKGDSLVKETISRRNSFFWVNHTWDHENLDCYKPVPNSGICRPATFAESLSELTRNISVAQSMGLPLDRASMVTPNISGLNNRDFLMAAANVGIKYLVSDTSRPEWQPASPNTGVRSPLVPSILFIPRRATNVFYNTKSGRVGALGSLPDEYNYFYGPNGIFRLGGPGGPPFFSTTQTHAQIVDRESDTYLGYMLRYEIYPLMFHQSNYIRYDGNNSLFTDVFNSTLNKFIKLSNLPVESLSQTEIGQRLEARMAYNAAGVQATYTPGQGITIRASSGSAKVPVTGICAAGCVTYGSQNISSIPVSANSPVSVPIY